MAKKSADVKKAEKTSEKRIPIKKPMVSVKNVAASGLQTAKKGADVKKTEKKPAAEKRIPIKKPKVNVENVVASVSLGVEFDLEAIAANLDNTEYEPEQFPGLICRLDKPSSAVLVFRSGKMVCTGARSPEAIREAVKEAINKLETVPKVKIPRKYEVTIQNIVASSDLGCDLNLDKIAFTLDNTEFEPEQFPGLVYRMAVPKVVFLLFRSGRIICTGAKFVSDVHKAIKKLQGELDAIGAM